MMMSPPPIPQPLESPSSDLVRSVIGEDLTIEGQAITIRCKGELEINGNIQAELHSQRLMVGKSGRVEGTISADNVEVWGQVSGTIKGARVSLHPGAEVEGDIGEEKRCTMGNETKLVDLLDGGAARLGAARSASGRGPARRISRETAGSS